MKHRLVKMTMFFAPPQEITFGDRPYHLTEEEWQRTTEAVRKHFLEGVGDAVVYYNLEENVVKTHALPGDSGFVSTDK